VITAVGTYLPRWGTDTRRVAGEDEDVVTMAVAAGRQVMAATARAAAAAGARVPAIDAVVLVSRDLPLLEGGNGAALLAGLGLPARTAVREQVGAAPATLDAVTDAATGTLVIGADLNGGAGAAAVLLADTGVDVTSIGRINRSLPVVTRDAAGGVTDYADPRLVRERGVRLSIERAGLDGKVAAVAGLAAKDAAALTEGTPEALPTLGASAALFAVAMVAERRGGGRVLAVEQATVAGVELGAGEVAVARDEARAATLPVTRAGPPADISIPLAAYERAFDAKLRLEADRCATCGTLAYPHRFRCLECGAEAAPETVPLPREAEIYTLATIHVPVPGLASPYTVVLAELGESGVRLLVRLTGAAPGSVAIGDRGHLVFRRVAVRTGVPDYGYAFLPTVREHVAA
jgi:uncharacterized OB-fold protein